MQRREAHERIRAMLIVATDAVAESRAMAHDAARMAADARTAVASAHASVTRASDRMWKRRPAV